MSAALLPCPFCGCAVKLEKTHKNRHEIYGERQWWGVRCTNNVNVGGTCAIEAIPTASPEAAIERWNRRAPAIAPPVAADAEPLEVMRANFEDWYMTHTSDIKAAPLGSRDSMLQWSSWIAARSGNYVARGGWQISPMPWGPAGAPVAAGSVDTMQRYDLTMSWGETVMEDCTSGDWVRYDDAIAWNAQECERAKNSSSNCIKINEELIQEQRRAEKAEADLKARDFFVDVLNCQVKKAQGEADVLFHRLNAVNGHLAMARERIEELETEIKVPHQG